MVGRKEQVVARNVQQGLGGRMAGVDHRLRGEGPEAQPVAGPQRGVAPGQSGHHRAVAVEPFRHAAELVRREPVGGVEGAFRPEVLARREAVDPGREIFGLAHHEFGPGRGAEPCRGADVIGMVVGHDQPLDRPSGEEAAQHAGPEPPRLGRVDAGVDHRPAALTLDEVHVDVIEPERERQAQPVQAGRDGERRAEGRRLRERKVERDHGAPRGRALHGSRAVQRQGGRAGARVASGAFRAHQRPRIRRTSPARQPMNLHLPWPKSPADPVDLNDYARRILTSRVYDVAIQTPLDALPALSRRLGVTALLKREDLQPVFSFKIRGAYNKMAGLPRDALDRGVICASAGNHAQGVAAAAQRLGVKATIVMPRTTPGIKIAGVRARGGARHRGRQFRRSLPPRACALRGARPDLRASLRRPRHHRRPGDVGMEILQQHPGRLRRFVPIGGGGLASGVAAYVKFLRPDVKVIGVEPDDAASMKAAIAADARVVLDRVGLFADGVAVRQAGVETFRICRACLDEVITVTTDEICAAVKDIFDDPRAVAEPAGEESLTGMKRYAEARGLAGQTLVAINSGANLNFDRLRHIAERAEIGEGREALLAVTIPEQAGSYRRFMQVPGPRAITEFNYRQTGPGIPAHIFVGVELRHGEAENAR